jgi:hypothetical protein
MMCWGNVKKSVVAEGGEEEKKTMAIGIDSFYWIYLHDPRIILTCEQCPFALVIDLDWTCLHYLSPSDSEAFYDTTLRRLIRAEYHPSPLFSSMHQCLPKTTRFDRSIASLHVCLVDCWFGLLKAGG